MANECCPVIKRNVDLFNQESKHFIIDHIDTPAGKIPKITHKLIMKDHFGAWKARWGVRRMKYAVLPGIYAIGNPTAISPVFVSANYKMSFDVLRRELEGIDCWILVLDTKGINVWCAAGKGTFGTKELISRIKVTELEKIIFRKKLIVPQLGAVGISAHEVQKATGFSVIYGPVRANDIKKFLDAGMKTTPDMRNVRFTLYDRLVLTPIEIVGGVKYLLILIAAFFLLSGFSSGGYSIENLKVTGIFTCIMLTMSYFTGTFIAPILLPWIPGRAFALKGAITGILFAGLIFYFLPFIIQIRFFERMSWFLITPAIVSFLAMMFTGASTYTSISGVKREMRFAIPVQIITMCVGVVLWITGRFV